MMHLWFHVWYTYDTIMIQWYSCIFIILADMARIGKESQQLELADIAAISRCRRQVQLSAEAMAQSYWILGELRVAGWNINCHLQSSWNFQGIAEIAGYFMNLYEIVNSRRMSLWSWGFPKRVTSHSNRGQYVCWILRQWCTILHPFQLAPKITTRIIRIRIWINQFKMFKTSENDVEFKRIDQW